MGLSSLQILCFLSLILVVFSGSRHLITPTVKHGGVDGEPSTCAVDQTSKTPTINYYNTLRAMLLEIHWHGLVEYIENVNTKSSTDS